MAHEKKLALIVDDSKTSAVTLSKMLDRLGVSVATVESGEDAIEYLHSQQPDMIFMDHMMPGMDGFAAVKAIKSDQNTASIPIVMHTTKGGDIYVGQAKALGAVDILSKPASDQDLNRVLETVASAKRRSDKPESGSPQRKSRVLSASDTMELDAHAIAMAADLSARQQRQRQAAEASRQSESPGAPNPVAGSLQREYEASFWGSRRQWLVALLFILSSVWLLYLYLPAQRLLAQQSEQQQVLLDTLQWSLNRGSSYDFGEPPLSAELVVKLQDLIPRLTKSGFTGSIVLEGHVGEFCLTQIRLTDGSVIPMLPEADLPLTGCSQIGYASPQAARESVQQSTAFAEYIKSSGLQLADAPIRINIVAMGSRSPQYPYPTNLQGLTAGDWNAIALRNNRVRIGLVADSALK